MQGVFAALYLEIQGIEILLDEIILASWLSGTWVHNMVHASMGVDISITRALLYEAVIGMGDGCLITVEPNGMA